MREEIKERPLVSVIMPAYNAEKTIRLSINSILNQTYTHFELIIVDDGSKDSTASIIKGYSDRRVKYYRNEQNMGLVETLNKAIGLTQGKYVARMDSDDIALPERLEYEVAYMESNRKCIICGAFARSFVEEDGTIKMGGLMKYETEDARIKDELAYECCFAHPTVMFRSEIFSKTCKRYNDDYLNSEDYNYWIDLMDMGEYHNIPRCLLHYRKSNTQMSASSDITKKNSSRARLNYIEKRYGERILNVVKTEKPSKHLIKKLKKEGINNPYLYKLLYLSFPKYIINDFIYYVFSGDVLMCNFKTAIQLLKRIVLKPLPVFEY